jgi:hypothetical protein
MYVYKLVLQKLRVNKIGTVESYTDTFTGAFNGICSIKKLTILLDWTSISTFCKEEQERLAFYNKEVFGGTRARKGYV